MNLLPVLIFVLAQVDDAGVVDEGERDERAPMDEAVVPPKPVKPSPPVMLRFDGAYAPRKLFTIPVTGADFGGGLFVQPSSESAVGGSLRGFVGGTENGLRVWDIRGLAEAEAIIADRLHLGAGLGMFLLGVERAARDETIRSWGPQVQAHARFDIVRDDYAIFVRGAASGGYEIYDGSFFWGPSIGAGFELDVAGKRNR